MAGTKETGREQGNDLVKEVVRPGHPRHEHEKPPSGKFKDDIQDLLNMTEEELQEKLREEGY